MIMMPALAETLRRSLCGARKHRKARCRERPDDQLVM
jgi:hypothetical protein